MNSIIQLGPLTFRFLAHLTSLYLVLKLCRYPLSLEHSNYCSARFQLQSKLSSLSFFQISGSIFATRNNFSSNRSHPTNMVSDLIDLPSTVPLQHFCISSLQGQHQTWLHPESNSFLHDGQINWSFKPFDTVSYTKLISALILCSLANHTMRWLSTHHLRSNHLLL